ncbi:uncharacterized protein DUF563 [Algoriphagus ratkowskyi]|uniref:Glycosyltransferase family 61 protein n=1 Tax=Algoriphagus ratkowskyi TaxID=57028 RepID=A0A2W7RF96_9BACT|nr:glycosyltransferase family 61 protein [Algoriphagus ratkowskyi]PZX57796.1 uncharacterized protein DUF563 [Algoriphagus ratkowskyi]TXD79060.1 glycosyltransferase family 61 protein [Algoriphagus ratkowskyi]
MSNYTLIQRFNARIVTPHIDNKFWRLVEEGPKITNVEKIIHEDQFDVFFPELNISEIKKDNPAHYKFLCHILTTYVYNLKNVTVEPQNGWVILNHFQLFKYSFPLVEDPWDGKKKRPSIFNYFIGKKTNIFLDEAISIRYAWQNYYHFFIDTLNQLFLLDKHKVPKHIPIIVPFFFPYIKFVQQFLDLSDFIDRKIIIQNPGEFYHIKNLTVCKDTFVSDGIFSVINSIDYLRKCEKNQKLLIVRPITHGRAILNLEDIKRIAINHGFLLVDPSNMSLKEQIELFSGASEIIGIHGAGLTNIIFRSGHSLKLLEIFPSTDLTPWHYKNLSRKLNFNYDFIIGEGRQTNNNFNLSPTLFENKILSFFDQ